MPKSRQERVAGMVGHRESLASAYLRLRTRPPLPRFFLEAVDAPLRLGEQAPAVPTNVYRQQQHPVIRAGDMMEIHGPPQAGKSVLIEHMLLTILTPPSAPGPSGHSHYPSMVHLHGHGARVALIDASRRFRIGRLRAMVERHAQECLARSTEQVVEDGDEETRKDALRAWSASVAHSALRNLDIYRASSLPQVHAIVRALYAAHPNRPRRRLPGQVVTTARPTPTRPPVSYLVIDALSDVHWPIRVALAPPPQAPPPPVATTAAPNSGVPPAGPLIDPVAAATSALATDLVRLGTECAVTPILVTWQPYARPEGGGDSVPARADPNEVLDDVGIRAAERMEWSAGDRVGRSLARAVRARICMWRISDGSHAQQPTVCAVQVVTPRAAPPRAISVHPTGIVDGGHLVPVAP
ncbi:hypothetical protein BC828DRAFT_381274 [Blastocladiella britannica]|nr:hypothetical protein BC828DRAFT_381274 [Blastocladiella britannica]